MDLLFVWDDWNLAHVAQHRVTRREAEYVIGHVQAPWPDQKGDDKLLVWGPTDSGRLLQVIFVFKRPDEIEFDSLSAEQWAELDAEDELIYVIHAMDLTPAMKRLYRRRRK